MRNLEFRFIILLCLLLLSVTSFADKIEIITGLSKPPFVIEANNNTSSDNKPSGIQLDLMTEAFAYSGTIPYFIHMPLGRNIMGYQKWDIEGVLTVPDNYEYSSMYLSKPYVSYQNVAISLVQKNLVIDSIADLSGKQIVAFQRAKKFIGGDYAKTVAYAIDYLEIADQSKQIDLLFSGGAEAIILEINIFKHFIAQQTQARFIKPVRFHYIFKEKLYSAGFKSEKLRDTFDLGIERLKQEGRYQLIHDQYLNKSNTTNLIEP